MLSAIAKQDRLVMIDKGILTIDCNRTKVDRKDIQKVKRILDELGIMDIIDGVSYCRTFRLAELIKDIHDATTLKAKNDGKVLSKNQCMHQEQIHFRELKIPHFCLIDFISLSQLNYEEAGFLAGLNHGT